MIQTDSDSCAVFFAYFYTFIQLKPEEFAKNLQENGGYIPGIRPGDETKKYISKVLSRLTVLGATFLVIIAGLPIIFSNFSGLSSTVTIGGTGLLIVVGVILLVPLQPILQTEELLPAFNNVVPALFGALGLKYFIKSPKIAVIPLVLMSALCIFVPAAISQTSLLLIPSGGLALAIGFILFKKGKI